MWLTVDRLLFVAPPQKKKRKRKKKKKEKRTKKKEKRKKEKRKKKKVSRGSPGGLEGVSGGSHFGSRAILSQGQDFVVSFAFPFAFPVSRASF